MTYRGVFCHLAPAARWAPWGNWAMGVRLKLLVTTSSAIALWIGGGGVASADSTTITFEPPTYHTGSIDGQNGWAGGETGTGSSGPINPLIDQSVVANPGYEGFGQQSWRISNAYTNEGFGDWPFSPSLVNEAGETMALNHNGALVYSGGDRQNHFDVQWSFAAADPTGTGTDCSSLTTCSYVSMAPDRGDGARMSYIRLEDDFSGLRVVFDDYQDKAPYGSEGTPASAQQGCGPEDNFIETTVASGLDRHEPHTVGLSIDFVDGPRNDVVKVFVDGKFVHTGTTWEDYFRWCTESGGGTGSPTFDQSRTVDQMIFQTRGSSPHPGNAGKGFLIDNLSYSSFSVNQCDEHNSDGDGDVQSSDGHHGHTTFHKHGCGHQDTDSVQHSDSDSGHNFQSTSVDAAQFSTAAQGRTAVVTGTGTDNGLPVAFTMTVVDYDGLLPPVYSLVLSDGYAFTGTMVSGALSVL
jgi:hypothetical protein